MPIHIVCQCGKQFDVPDAHRGERFPCSGCGTSLLIEPSGGPRRGPRFDDEWERGDEPARTSSLAIWSLVLGIVPCVPFVGIILGILALVGISRSRGRLTGQGIAIAGLTLSVLWITAAPILLLPAVTRVREAAARMNSSNNLKQMGIAFHSYQDRQGTLPAQAIYSRDGKPLLSWRVALLPHLEQDNLYQQFKLDEPWDSDHNKALLPKMPKVYENPRFPPPSQPGMTHYQVFAGQGSAFDGNRRLRVQMLPDSAATILVVEAPTAVPWTKPEDIPFDANSPLPKHEKGLRQFVVLFADGSVKSVSINVDEARLRAAIQREGVKTGDLD